MGKMMMTPAPGERKLGFVGDLIRFTLNVEGFPSGWKGVLRTNLGRAHQARAEIVKAYTGYLPLAGASWRDVPMQWNHDQWFLEFPLHEVGFFKAKAYLVDTEGRQHWPDGPDVGISVHPNKYRTANTIYCAFIRLIGHGRHGAQNQDSVKEQVYKNLDQEGCTVIPRSGKLRDLIPLLPHIMGNLGCRIIHLLPINPTPTTYARYGRYGSPYASLDFSAIDPALVEFDRRSTGIDQFCELSQAVHAQGGHLFLDLAINHTGWGSVMQENHPEWFLKGDDGHFLSPGAWGNTWEDLVELSHRTPDLWDDLSEVFLTWCRRGVDGFRCDAGYKVPLVAWQYIIAHVRQEFPETIFLLEGLGGAWEATEHLLAEGGMQWAYSELFQNYSGKDIAWYLDYSLKQSARIGLWIHYSETHDNQRLAQQGKTWSLLRNRLCALTSVCGGFGFTSGVEWLAKEKISVHGCTGLAWDNPDNLVQELGKLNHLLADHPCFFDGAILTRLSSNDSTVYALHRLSEEGLDHVVVLANTDCHNPQAWVLDNAVLSKMGGIRCDLLSNESVETLSLSDGRLHIVIPPGGVYCLAGSQAPKGLAGNLYREARALASWAIACLVRIIPAEKIGYYSWRELAGMVKEMGAEHFLAAINGIDPDKATNHITAILAAYRRDEYYSQVVNWDSSQCSRITLVPPHHWVLVHYPVAFRLAIRIGDTIPQHRESTFTGTEHVACIEPQCSAGDAVIHLIHFGRPPTEATIRFLPERPQYPWFQQASGSFKTLQRPGANQRLVSVELCDRNSLALLTNGRGGMARLSVDLGKVQSKYDCLLGANLHPFLPVDRHVFVKRMRAWICADGFLSPLNGHNLISFIPGPPAEWIFLANAGDGRGVEIGLHIDMLEEKNTTMIKLWRLDQPPLHGKDLPDNCDVSLTIRFDIEDRNFHWETERNPGSESHFNAHIRPLSQDIGFEFSPASDRVLKVYSNSGRYHHQGEWCNQIPHPIEQSRGQREHGDAFSPGWFELPLKKGSSVILTACADAQIPTDAAQFVNNRKKINAGLLQKAGIPEHDSFGAQLATATKAFLVRRDKGASVIAGYPWFLDWGRDSLICARGLLEGGWIEEVKAMALLFGGLEQEGTLPNSIHGEDASNRDTSDAPLWYGCVCEEIVSKVGTSFWNAPVNPKKKTVLQVLSNIAYHYAIGTPNKIRVDPTSGLVWSPAHFTWMDTQYPAGTPREGYPIEIQVLWIKLLRILERMQSPLGDRAIQNPPLPWHSWNELRKAAEKSFESLYWMPDRGYFADVILSPPGIPAYRGVRDNALRSNYLIGISLDVIRGQCARQSMAAALQYLAIPGAMRSLAPLAVSPPLEIRSQDGHLLNDPCHPYWGHYLGDEDTRRKPAYHNGTAWTWHFPIFCESLAKAWDMQPEALKAAIAYLGSMEHLLRSGCLGHLPEILDGDAPHQARGCDAQAWAVTEALRVWKLLTRGK